MEDPGTLVLGVGAAELAEFNEPIAEKNFNRKKMLQLERGLGSLQKSTRQHTEVVSQIETGMKAMISETDLRRAIGLAFQEFEHRLEDAFQDSNRKCLAMFSKRDDVSDLQEILGKKVNWHDHNLVLKKLAEMKTYQDTMANDIFIGHLDALRGEFYKKADKDAVEQALKLKADNDDVNEVRARLERLEVLLAHTDARQTAALEAMRDETGKKLREQNERHVAKTKECKDAIASLKADHLAAVVRLGSAESGIQALEQASQRLREVQELLNRRQEEEIMPTIGGMQEQLTKIEVAAGQLTQDVRTLEHSLTDFQNTSQKTFRDLWAQVNANKDHVEFLLQETDMIKRRSREMTKKQDKSFKDLTDEQEKFSQQLQTLDSTVKKQARDVRAADSRVAKVAVDDTMGSLAALAGLRALPLPAPNAAENHDPNDRLRGMMDQLEKLAGGGATIPYNPERPPLPTGALRGGSEDTSRLPRLHALADQVPIDSARGGTTTSTVRGMYGLSPRMSPSSGKKKTR